MILKGFIGPSYVGTSRNVAYETLYNWYPQRVEAAEPIQATYYPRPGLSVYASLSDWPIRALFEQDGRCFVVAGQTLFELFANAAPTNRGTLSAKDANPATITSNGTAGSQLYITSGGRADIFNLTTNVLTAITAAGYPSATPMGTYLDTYFATIKGNSAQFNISGIDDGTSWAALDFAVRVAGSDNLVGILQFNKVLWLIGSQTTEPWYDSGSVTFPFQSVPQVLIEMGCCAPFTIVRGSGFIGWLHRSERGQGIFVIASDYAPKRVSTYAVEAIWASYASITDAVAYCLTWQGHEFVTVHFPTGNATWVYDVSEQLWSQWSWWNTTTGAQDRFRGWVHCEAFGQHLVGDWETGVVYQMDATLATDAGQSIVWERTAAHVKQELVTAFYSNFQVDLEAGLGGTYPQAYLSWSNDGGHTFGNAVQMSTGAAGQYQTRCRVAGNLGSARDRLFRWRISNDVPPRPNAAYVDVLLGTS
jgi:hypothetical protein